MSNLVAKSILGIPITALPFDHQVSLICNWAQQNLNHFVCVANVHMVIEAHWHSEYAEVLRQASLVTPDGMPLVWMLRSMGAKQQNRVAGMDLFLALCMKAEQLSIPIFFLGSQQTILERMKSRLLQDFPTLEIVGMEPLPFRPLQPEEQAVLLDKLQQSCAGLVFVSLGCPKQERWMSQNMAHIPAVMIGLGGVFPVYAGILRRAPCWVRELGLEWFFRLVQEPRRLWKRYLTTNLVFIYLVVKNLLGYGRQEVFKKAKYFLSRLGGAGAHSPNSYQQKTPSS